MISLCMIVKNEAQFIEKCLESVSDYVNDIVVVDTGSTDNTKEIAVKNSARVFEFEWVEDFAAARNFAASHAKYDWILSLDADETVISFDKKQVEIFQKDLSNIGSITIYDHSAGDLVFSDKITRMYNRQHFCFAGSIHEQVTPIREGVPFKRVFIPVEIEHCGYLPEIMEAKNKLARNRRMLEKALAQKPDDPYLLYQMGKAYFALSVDNSKAVEYFEKALAQNPNPVYDYVYGLVECYGYALLKCGQYKKSFDILKFLNYYGNNPHFKFLLAHIYLNNGKLLEALEYFESCIGLNKNDVTGICSYLSYYNIGVILEVAGMTDNAKAYYMQCGDYEPALKRLSDLK